MCYEKYLGALIIIVKKKLCKILKHTAVPHFIFQMGYKGVGIH